MVSARRLEQEAREQALVRFPGAVVIVSHDRSFLAALDPRVVELE